MSEAHPLRLATIAYLRERHINPEATPRLAFRRVRDLTPTQWCEIERAVPEPERGRLMVGDRLSVVASFIPDLVTP